MRARTKRYQLYLRKHYTEIRHWLTIAIGVLLVVFTFAILVNSNNQNKRLEAQNERLESQTRVIEELSLQNKELNQTAKVIGEENKSIAKQNRSYSRCIAEIIALYTRTLLPITVLDLDNCTVDSQTDATNDTETGGTAPM